MAKRLNLVVFIDGTGNNDFKQGECDRTNISRLWHACEHVGNDDVEQKVYYKPGVGTRDGEAFTGSAFGMYLDERIEEALGFLQNERTKPSNAEKDIRVYLYGFSRGAYAVRCLAARCGQEIEVLGVFDTVKATLENSVDISSAPSYVNYVFHAMAIDEHRKDFDITRFNPRKGVLEVWFAGCHSDIGGSYIEGSLANITLNWMVDLSEAQGLLVDREQIEKTQVAYAEVPMIHNEKEKWSWKFWDTIRFSRHFDRKIASTDMIHPTVAAFRSLEYAPGYLPSNMVVWNGQVQTSNIA